MRDSEHRIVDPRDVCVPLDLNYLRPAFRHLDRPSANADAITTACFCTNPYEIVVTETVRKRIAKDIACEVERFLLNAFEEHDTVMGYPKE